MNNLKVKNFIPKWNYLKSKMLNLDADFFEEVVDIESTVGRVLSVTEKAYNPRYAQYWFPVCRCHWGVIFPCWLLNKRSFKGPYQIITNEKHSAIINIETNEIYDPTYSANGVDLNNTLDQFKDGYEVFNVLIHAAHVDKDICERMMEFDKEIRKLEL